MNGQIDLGGVVKMARSGDLALLFSEGETEQWKDGESEKGRKERGNGRRVGKERQKDFTVCLTGRPEGPTCTHTHSLTHSHTEYALCVGALSAWLVGVADPQQLWAKLTLHVRNKCG